MVVIATGKRRADWPALFARNPGYLAYFLARSLSVGGSQLTYAATPLICLTVYHSPVAAGVAGTCGYGGSIAFGLLGTPLADRWSRRAVMLGADGIRALAMALVALALFTAGRPPIILLFLAVSLVAAASGAFNSASAAFLADLVVSSDFAAASAANQARDFGLAVLGPILGAGLVVGHSSLPFWIDAASYLLSLLCLVSVPDLPTAVTATERYLCSLRTGLSHLRTDRIGTGLIVTTSMLNVLLSVLIYSTLADAVTRGHARWAGIVLGMQAVGGLIGTVFVRRLYQSTPPRQVFWAHITLWSLGAFVVISYHNLVVAAVCLAGMWMTVPLFRTVVSGHLVENHSQQYRGRVFGLFDLVVSVSASIGPIAAGLAFTHSATGWLVVAVVGLAAACAVAGVAMPLRGQQSISVRR